jgi:hypothetical protein
MQKGIHPGMDFFYGPDLDSIRCPEERIIGPQI